MTQFNHKNSWFNESDSIDQDKDFDDNFLDEDDDLLSQDPLDEVDGDEEQINEVRYIDPANLDRYSKDEIEKVKDAQGNDRYKRKTGAVSSTKATTNNSQDTANKKEKSTYVEPKNLTDALSISANAEYFPEMAKMQKEMNNIDPKIAKMTTSTLSPIFTKMDKLSTQLYNSKLSSRKSQKVLKAFAEDLFNDVPEETKNFIKNGDVKDIIYAYIKGGGIDNEYEDFDSFETFLSAIRPKDIKKGYGTSILNGDTVSTYLYELQSTIKLNTMLNKLDNNVDLTKKELDNFRLTTTTADGIPDSKKAKYMHQVQTQKEKAKQK